MLSTGSQVFLYIEGCEISLEYNLPPYKYK